MVFATSLLDIVDKFGVPVVGLILSLVGLWAANNFRLQMRVKLAEHRTDAYSRLWALTGVAAPTRLDGWGDAGYLRTEERLGLWEAMTTWYYSAGSGMFLADATRDVYLNAKHNLICATSGLRPRGLDAVIRRELELIGHPDAGADEFSPQLRGILAIRQFSLLRTQLKGDLAVYGRAYAGNLSVHEMFFLVGSGVRLRSKVWRRATKLNRRELRAELRSQERHDANRTDVLRQSLTPTRLLRAGREVFVPDVAVDPPDGHSNTD